MAVFKHRCICGGKYRCDEKTFNEHLKNDHRDEALIMNGYSYLCFCGKGYYQEKRFNEHLNGTHCEIEKRTCIFCQCEFNSLKGCEKHMADSKCRLEQQQQLDEEEEEEVIQQDQLAEEKYAHIDVLLENSEDEMLVLVDQAAPVSPADSIEQIEEPGLEEIEADSPSFSPLSLPRDDNEENEFSPVGSSQVSVADYDDDDVEQESYEEFSPVSFHGSNYNGEEEEQNYIVDPPLVEEDKNKFILRELEEDKVIVSLSSIHVEHAYNITTNSKKIKPFIIEEEEFPVLENIEDEPIEDQQLERIIEGQQFPVPEEETPRLRFTPRIMNIKIIKFNNKK